MAGTESAKVNDKAKWYDDQTPMWERSDDLMGGTEVMRQKERKYLPQFELEGSKSYDIRLSQTVLTNLYGDHFHTAMGLLFAEDTHLEGCKIPEDQLENIDNLGHSVKALAEMIAAQLLLKGMHHVYVDMPPNTGAETLEDDIRLGLRPYWVSVPCERAFNAFYELKANIRRLTQIRLKDEKVTYPSKFERECKNAIRVVSLERGVVSFETWVADDEKGTEYNPSIDPNDNGVLAGLDQIPLATAVVNDKKFMTSRAVLDDIAFKTIEHWCSSSDQRNILTVTRYPIMTQIGTEEPVVEISPGTILHSKGRQTNDAQDVAFDYISPESAPIECGERDMKRIVEEARVLGNKNMVGNRTATGDVIDITISAAPLQAVISAVENCVNTCLGLHAKWLGMDAKDGGKFVMSRDFGITASEQIRSNFLLETWKGGAISNETLINEGIDLGMLRTDIDPEAEAIRVAKQSTGLFTDRSMQQNQNPDDNDDDVVDV